MITRRFHKTVDEIEGLIKKELWSAPYSTFSRWQDVKVLLAVSGGIDSMCMADLYYRKQFSCNMAIAHCNFRLRGDESDADEAMVSRWAQDRGICLHVRSFDTVSYAERNGLSIEMAARELRYKWFAQLCKEHGYTYVAVAHHADDSVPESCPWYRNEGHFGNEGDFARPIYLGKSPIQTGQTYAGLHAQADRRLCSWTYGSVQGGQNQFFGRIQKELYQT